MGRGISMTDNITATFMMVLIPRVYLGKFILVERATGVITSWLVICWVAWKNPGKVHSLVMSRQVKFAELYDAQQNKWYGVIK